MIWCSHVDFGFFNLISGLWWTSWQWSRFWSFHLWPVPRHARNKNGLEYDPAKVIVLKILFVRKKVATCDQGSVGPRKLNSVRTLFDHPGPQWFQPETFKDDHGEPSQDNPLIQRMLACKFIITYWLTLVKSVFFKVEKLNLTGTSILANGNQFVSPVRLFELVLGRKF